MRLQQHNLCTRKQSFAREVKFYVCVHRVSMAMATNADQLKWRQIRISAVSVSTPRRARVGNYRNASVKWVCSTTVVGAKGFVYLRFGTACVCICVFIWREIPIFSSQGPLWYWSGRRSCWAGSVGIGTYKAISVETCKCATTSQNMCFWSILHCRAPTWEKELLERRTFFFIRIDYQTFTHISVAGCLWNTTWSGSLLGSLRLSYWSVWHL